MLAVAREDLLLDRDHDLCFLFLSRIVSLSLLPPWNLRPKKDRPRLHVPIKTNSVNNASKKTMQLFLQHTITKINSQNTI